MSRGDRQSWPGLAVAAVVGAAVAGAALWGIACTLIVVLQPHGELLNAGIATAVGAGFALIALSLCLALRRLGVMGSGSDGADGQGWGRDVNDPVRPQPASDGPDPWPELERELREYLEAHERTPSLVKGRQTMPVAG
ncbi:MAG: hypothetical protein ACTHQQ_17490 [Solirubrobacteraceae bacterium]